MIKDIDTELEKIRVYIDNPDDPYEWSNNKRKNHGYPLRRRCGYRQSKEKFYMCQFYKILEETIDKVRSM